MLLDARTGRTVWERPYPFRRGQMGAQALFGTDGALITSASHGETLVWDARTGKIVRRYATAGHPALSPDGRTLALARNSEYVGDPSAAIAILDLRTGRHRDLSTELPDEWVMSLEFTRDGTRIVAPSFAGTHVWDIATGKIVDSYREGECLGGSGSDLVIDRRGLAIFTTGDGTITAWDPEGARRVARVFPYAKERPGCLGYTCSVTAPRQLGHADVDGRRAGGAARSPHQAAASHAARRATARPPRRSRCSPAAAGSRPAGPPGP